MSHNPASCQDKVLTVTQSKDVNRGQEDGLLSFQGMGLELLQVVLLFLLGLELLRVALLLLFGSQPQDLGNDMRLSLNTFGMGSKSSFYIRQALHKCSLDSQVQSTSTLLLVNIKWEACLTTGKFNPSHPSLTLTSSSAQFFSLTPDPHSSFSPFYPTPPTEFLVISHVIFNSKQIAPI